MKAKLGPDSRIALLMHSALDQDLGKLGFGMLRYSPAQIVAVIDRENGGKCSSEVTRINRHVPIVSSVNGAVQLGAEIIVLAIAPPGGKLPEEWLPDVLEAAKQGLSIVNPFHEPLNSVPNLVNLLHDNAWTWDIRSEPDGLFPATGRSISCSARRILTVGTDMAVGKMTASLELVRTLKNHNKHADFLATGQIGIAISGRGVALDAIRVDFAAGAIEAEVITRDEEGAEYIVVEGQGALCHPAASANLALIRGTMPTHLLLAHRAHQKSLRRLPGFSIPPLTELIKIYEDLSSCAGAFPRPKTLGVALNTSHLDEHEAKEAIQKTEDEVCLPVSDPVRHGCDVFLDRLIDIVSVN